MADTKHGGPRTPTWGEHDDIPMNPGYFDEDVKVVVQDEYQIPVNEKKINIKKLEISRKQIEVNLNEDEKADTFGGMNQGSPRSLEYKISQEKNFENIDRIPIPSGIDRAFREQQCERSFMGVFPQILRAYVTMDNKLFLWNCMEAKGFNVYSEIDQQIVSVGLVKPHKHLNFSENSFLLVITTRTDVKLVEIEFIGDRIGGSVSVYDEIKLNPTEFTATTDNVPMLKVIGTPDSRVFMGGKDGNVYELYYGRPSCYPFNRKCRKYNHSKCISHWQGALKTILPPFVYGKGDPIIDMVVDSNRGYLYALCYNTTIMVWKMQKDGYLSLIATKTDVVNNAISVLNEDEDISRSNEDDWTAEDFSIVSIHVVPRSESENAVLVAITNHGHRIFFHIESYVESVSLWRSCLQVLHVYQCPSEVSQQRGRAQISARYVKDRSPESVRKAYYLGGVTMLADSVNHAQTFRINHPASTSNSLIFIHEETWRAQYNHAPQEAVECDNEVGGHILAFAEIPPIGQMAGSSSQYYFHSKEKLPLKGLRPLAYQHVFPSRHFIVLTNKEIAVYKKNRPLDLLWKTMAGTHSVSNALFNDMSFVELRAMYLALICDPSSYGGKPAIKHRAKSRFLDLPVRLEGNGSFLHQRSTIHDAMYRYASRALRPVWIWTVCSEKRGVSMFRYLTVDWERIVPPVRALRKFIAESSSSSSGRGGVGLGKDLFSAISILPDRPPVKNDQRVAERKKRELKSIRALLYLLDVCLEAFTILQLCTEGINIEALREQLDAQAKTHLRTLKFSLIVTTTHGLQLLKSLIDAVMYLRREDSVGELFHKKCSILFGKGDFEYFKGLKSLHEARKEENFHDKTRRNRHLEKALRYFKGAAHGSDFKIRKVCENLQKLKYYRGVVVLALTRATLVQNDSVQAPASSFGEAYERSIDADIGFDGRAHGENSSSASASWKAKEIHTCHRCILDMFRFLLITKQDAAPPQVDQEDQLRLGDSGELKELRDSAVQEALNASEDDHGDFLRKLFEWFVDNDRAKHLTRLKSPLLISFLESKMQIIPSSSADDTKHNLGGAYMMKKYAGVLHKCYYESSEWQKAVDLLFQIGRSDQKAWSLSEKISLLRKCRDYANRIRRDSRFGLDEDWLAALNDNIIYADIQQKLLLDLKTLLDDLERRAGAQHPNGGGGGGRRANEEDLKLETAQALVAQCEKGLIEDPLTLINIAREAKFFEHCLHVAKVQQLRDQTYIKTWWKNLIIIRFKRAKRQNKSWRDEFLTEMPSEFSDDPVMFPAAFIAELLEKLNQKYTLHNKKETFALQFFRKVKVPLRAQIGAYEQLLNKADKTLTKTLVESVIRLVEDASKNENEFFNNAAGLYNLVQRASSRADSSYNVPVDSRRKLKDLQVKINGAF